MLLFTFLLVLIAVSVIVELSLAINCQRGFNQLVNIGSVSFLYFHFVYKSLFAGLVYLKKIV